MSLCCPVSFVNIIFLSVNGMTPLPIPLPLPYPPPPISTGTGCYDYGLMGMALLFLHLTHQSFQLLSKEDKVKLTK